jgi:hypothetical protein
MIHALKFEGIVISDGIISSYAGLVEDPVSYWKLFNDSSIENVLCLDFAGSDSSGWLYLYDNPAYYGTVRVMEAYQACLGFLLTQEQK